MNGKASSIIIFAVAFFSSCLAQFDLSGCVKRKTCIFVSANCEEKGNCEKIVSYTTESDDWVVIELFYNTTYSDTNYAAVGFSEDTQMGEEGVTHCGFDKTNRAGVFLSQNEGKRNIPLNLTKKNAAEYVELLQASHTTSSIYCKFRQKIAPDKMAQKAHVPDLNHTYYLLLAYGKTDNYEELGIHSLDERSRDFPSFTSTPVNIAAWREAQIVPVKQQSNRKLVIIHGVLMLVGWMWLVPAAITAARYLREHWSKRMPFGLKIWFHIHRTMNSLAVLFVLISVLLIFIGKDWRWTGPAIGRSIQRNLSAGAFHSLIGAIAVGIMTVQLMGALLRCDKGSRYRPIFNWLHRVSGLLAFLLAQFSVVLAVIFFHVWIARWAAVLLYTVYFILIILLLLLTKKINSLKEKQSASVGYIGRQYHQEQIIIKTEHDDKVKRVMALVVLIFNALSVLITVVMMALMLISL